MKCVTPDGILIFNDSLLDEKNAFCQSNKTDIISHNIVHFCYYLDNGIMIIYNKNYYKISDNDISFLNEDRIKKLKSFL